ncbi:MAG TPA: four helix bundle protein [Candidatus Saccharimonadales bacterium]|nr:four helix bundle protein [Candidatus Saccharimonadales bacterium]
MQNVESKKKDDFKQQFKKRCFHFSLSILALAEILRKDRKNWPLLDQLVRSATSIGANVVEGGNSTSRKEFINYFQIALKSASETLYWLALLREINPAMHDELSVSIQECTEIKKLITTIILHTKDKSKF